MEIMNEKLLNLQDQADRQESNLEVEIKEVEGTPFRIVRNEKEVSIIMGDQVLKRGFNEIEEAEDYVASKPWELILIAGAVYNEFITKIRKENDN